MSERVTVKTIDGERVEASNGKHSLFLALPVVDGGRGEGLGPHETLLSALGACTSMTLQAYSRRKGWPLEGVEVSLARAKAPVGVPDAKDVITVDLKLIGPLDDAQRQRLLEIATKCPVRKTLESDLEIRERLAS